MASLPPAALAFDSIAAGFDRRFGTWASVAAQRRAVRSALAGAFPAGARLLEVGGGTGEDAQWLLERGRRVMLTDASPAMVEVAAGKLAGLAGAETAILPAERMEGFAAERAASGAPPFDGAYSNFAALNCVTDLSPFARGLAQLVRPGGSAMLVVFGVACPGEMITELLLGRPRNMVRRFARGDVAARLSRRSFTVRYHRQADLADALAPWFEPRNRVGIGVFVPPSAAEPWISRHPRLLAGLERLDSLLAHPLAVFGDHILYRFVRTDAVAPGL